MKREFRAGKGSTFGDDKAQIYGEFIWKLREENGNVLTPKQLIREAKPKNSPIHDFFEWDNTIAAEKYRLWQARYLLGRIEIIIESDGEENQIRAFHNISIETKKTDEHERGYVTLEDVQSNEDYLSIVLKNALEELRGWEKRYSQYKRLRIFKSLKPIFRIAKEVIRKEARI